MCRDCNNTEQGMMDEAVGYDRMNARVVGGEMATPNSRLDKMDARTGEVREEMLKNVEGLHASQEEFRAETRRRLEVIEQILGISGREW